jgi:CheY-like chemotaxis protein
LPDPDPSVVLLELRVSDTGIGVDASDAARLFTAFEQGDASTTRRYGGTGLGLAINARIAQMMGGAVGVDGAPGKGSTFWLTARLRTVDAGAAAVPDAVPASTAPAHVPVAWARRADGQPARALVAEDHPPSREVMAGLLGHLGLRTDLAEHGAQAVDMAAGGDYDVILLDLQMPGLDGLAAARAIRSQPRNARTPIIAMTASAFASDRQACLDAGMNDHVAKPVQFEPLRLALVQQLGRSARAAAPGAPPGPLLDRLDALLAQDDIAAQRLFESSRAALHAALEGRDDLLARHIQEFAFSAALAELRRLRVAG